MHTILLIGKMNNLLKDMNDYLRQYFTVQISTENPQSAVGMIKVTNPELVLISLVGWFDSDAELFRRLQKEFPKLPVLTLGTDSERAGFMSFYESGQFEHLIRPLANKDVLSAVCTRLDLNEKQVIDSAVKPGDGRPKVLVVDDNVTTLRNLKSILEDKYNVTLANSGMKAMTSIGKDRPDVILLDYEMPVCDGRQTLEMIRADEDLREIPVIFLTGVNSREHIEAVLKLRPAGYMLKPAVPAKLKEAIDKACEKRRSMLQ